MDKVQTKESSDIIPQPKAFKKELMFNFIFWRLHFQFVARGLSILKPFLVFFSPSRKVLKYYLTSKNERFQTHPCKLGLLIQNYTLFRRSIACCETKLR